MIDNGGAEASAIAAIAVAHSMHDASRRLCRHSVILIVILNLCFFHEVGLWLKRPSFSVLTLHSSHAG